MNPATAHRPAAAEPAVRIREATKIYSRSEGRADTIKQRLIGAMSARQRHDLIVALDGLDLEIAAGEAFGLIGPNGSGKSTLLKLIAGITHPNQGSIQARGRVLGLIELGAGFHPDLTGDENIRLQGAIYGLSAAEVAAAVEPILDFSDLRGFRSMPVKHYSTGMYVRLGFAIAMHARPEVLLVDEVLSVGDQEFQERCLREIRRLHRQGVAIVFVTHHPEQAERICDRVLWLEQGRTRMLGPATEVLAAYHQDMIERRHNQSRGPLEPAVIAAGMPGRFGTGEARIEAVRLMDRTGRVRANFSRGEPFRIEVDVRGLRPEVRELDCLIPIDPVSGGAMLALPHARRDHRPLRLGPDGRGTFRLDCDRPPLLPGRYRITIAISPPERPTDHYDVLYRLFTLSIDHDPDWETVGMIELRPTLDRHSWP